MHFSLSKFNNISTYSMLCVVLIIVTMMGNSNTDQLSAPSMPFVSDKNSILVWNNLTTQIGIREKLSPPEFSRTYSLVHISMYDSLLAATGKKQDVVVKSYDNKSLSDFSSVVSSSSIAEAASSVLLYLFPNYAAEIARLKAEQVSHDKGVHNTITTERAIGRKVSQAVINYAKTDNSNLMGKDNNIHVGKNNCTWNGIHPVNPSAGYWKTYILKSGVEIQPQRPFSCGSQADLLDLRQTYKIWKHRSPEQVAAVHYWGNKPPPVIWNTILNQQIEKYRNMSIFDVAYVSAYLNVAMYDAFVSCWYTKYDYWTARPIQRITNITTVIPTPNFPGYTSGHSVISMVASRVLGEMFPDEKYNLRSQAIEAGLSRVWAGIHFKQDVVEGMNQGDKIADRVVEEMRSKPHSAFLFDYR